MLLIQFENEDFRESFDSLLSGLLPHENYDPKMFLDILMGINRFVKVEEMTLEYRVLFNLIEDVLKVFSSVTKQSLFVTITRDLVSDTLQSNLMEFIIVNGYKFKDWFEKKGISPNFSIPLNQESGASALYNEVMELYDRCFEKATPSGEVFGRFLTFKNVYTSAVAQACLNAQVEIMTDKFWFNNRYYKGSEDWLSFISDNSKELETRLNDNLHTASINLNDSFKVEEIFRAARETFIPIGEFGIPDIDEVPISTNMLCVLAGNSNAGKTLYACYLATNLLMNNKKVLFMCGEAPPAKILAHITSNLIYKKYNKFVTFQQILNDVNVSEEVQRLINLASIELSNNPNLTLRTAYSYENLYKELVDDYEKYKMDAVFIDHSLTLLRDGRTFTDKDCVDTLAVQCREFKRAFPVFVCVTSHLSVEAQQELSRKGVIMDTASVTKASATLHSEADSVIIIVSKPEFDKQGLRGFINYKSRGSAKTYKYDYMRVLFTANEWYYDLRDQDGGANSIDNALALNEVESAYLSEDDSAEFELDFDE